jgi:AraC-like DNA-binding protein
MPRGRKLPGNLQHRATILSGKAGKSIDRPGADLGRHVVQKRNDLLDQAGQPHLAGGHAFELGADDYISKPFDINILKTKVENLLSLRRSLKEKYTGEMVIKPTNVTITSPDERFLHKAIHVVEKNISDPDLDIDKFATEIGVSRMQLYRKLAALTDMTVKEFIRDIRLKRAAQMLIQKKMTVSEVAYAVGFRDLSHFRKCFRQQFGMNASEYIENQKEVPS